MRTAHARLHCLFKNESSSISRRDEWALASRSQFEGVQGLKLHVMAKYEQDYGVLSALPMKLADVER